MRRVFGDSAWWQGKTEENKGKTEEMWSTLFP
jgi:hypothetical protein